MHDPTSSAGGDWINHPMDERASGPIGVFVAHRNIWAADALRIALGRVPDLAVVEGPPDLLTSPEGLGEAGVDVLLLEATSDAPRRIASLKAASRVVRVVVLATDNVAVDLFTACIAAGAVGIVSGSYSLAQIAEAIRRAASGWVVLTPEQLAIVVSDRQVSKVDAENARRCATLTERERRVLEILASGASAVETGRTLGISPSTVQTHLKNIMRKLDAPSKFSAVMKAWQAGIIEEPHQEE